MSNKPFRVTPGFRVFLDQFRQQKLADNPRMPEAQIVDQAQRDYQSRSGDPIGGDKFEKQWDDEAKARLGGDGGAQQKAPSAPDEPPAPLPKSDFSAKLGEPDSKLYTPPAGDPKGSVLTGNDVPPPPADTSGYAAQVSPPSALMRQDNLGDGKMSDPYMPGGSKEFAQEQQNFQASMDRVNAGDMSGFKAALGTPTPSAARQPQLTEAEKAAGASVGPGTGPPGTASFTDPKGNSVNLTSEQMASANGVADATKAADAAKSYAAPLAPPTPSTAVAANVGGPAQQQAALSEPDEDEVKRRKGAGSAASAGALAPGGSSGSAGGDGSV